MEDSPRNSFNLDSIASRYSVGVIDRTTPESVGVIDRTSMFETKDGSFFIFGGFFALTVCSLRSSSSSPSSPSIGSSIPSSSFSSSSRRPSSSRATAITKSSSSSSPRFRRLTKFKPSKLSFLFSAFIASSNRSTRLTATMAGHDYCWSRPIVFVTIGAPADAAFDSWLSSVEYKLSIVHGFKIIVFRLFMV